MKKISFAYPAYIELTQWQNNPKIFKKINQLLKDIVRTPFNGLGKPEPLKNRLTGLWSRRITEEHRLIYEVKNNEVLIYSCKGHYSY